MEINLNPDNYLSEEEKKKIEDVLSKLFDYSNLVCNNRTVILESFRIYKDKNIDYADALLIAYYCSGKENKMHRDVYLQNRNMQLYKKPATSPDSYREVTSN